jgi:peptide/nickel transport system substrate-binding protein
MVSHNPRSLRVMALGGALTLILAACGPAATSTPDGSEPPAASDGASAAPSEGGGPQPGGTIFMIQSGTQWNRIDPQRAYTGEDLAFFGSTITRSLVSYTFSEDTETSNTLQPDLATDTGTANEDATEWSFTLRDGITWQDGSPVTCEDVKYGVSRTFATDIISEGPTYQIQYLDIPTLDDGTSAYKGPYTGEGQELYDQAVVCDGNTITFHLGKPIPDFNYTTTLGFSPVPEAADSGEGYDSADVVSNGPYQIDSYTTGNGGKFVLVRNPNWDPASDPIRKAYPDRWEMHFGIEAEIQDQRLIASTGDDANTIQYGNVRPENLPQLFVDPQTPQPQFEGRVNSAYDAYSLYIFINVQKVPNVKIRQAMAVALDREALRVNAGGDFAGDLADGVIKPNIGQDYAPTGWADDLFGEPVPPTGNVELAQQLIADSGEAAPTLQYDYPQSTTNDQAAAIVKSSLERAGFTINPNPIDPGTYYSIVFNPDQSGEFGSGGWGPDWPNASTVIPPLFTQAGGWDLSQVDDADFNARVQDALTTLDRAEQATKWQELNQFAAEQAWVIPTRFTLSQVIAGTNVAPTYSWPPYGSWPYAEMYLIDPGA